jgi:uncharacterized protein (TIGR03437 family)
LIGLRSSLKSTWMWSTWMLTLALFAASGVRAQSSALLTNPTSFTFTHQIGNLQLPPPANLSVLSTGNTVVPFTIRFEPTNPVSAGQWILPAASGTQQTTANIQIVPSPQNLGVGTYQGRLVLEPTTPGVTGAEVPVTMRVVLQSELDVQPKTLAFTSVVNQAPAPQTIQVNTTGSTLNFTASAVVNNGPQGWLVVDPTTGATNRSVAVSVNPAGLTPGTYTGVVNITSGATQQPPQQVQVSYTVTATPTLQATPSGITFNFQIGTTNPPAQSIAITSGGNPVSFTATAVSGATPGWLSVTPTTANTPSNLSVAVSPAGLAAGTYTGRIDVAATGLGTLQIPVTLNISTLPLLNVSASSLTFNSQFGQSVPTQTVNLTSTSTPLGFNFSIESQGPWFAGVRQGEQTPGSIIVGAIPTGLAPGQYTGRLVISAPQAGNNPQTVNLTLNVSNAVVLQVTPATLSFSAVSGGATPPFQTFNVAASDASAQPFTITRTTTDGGNWLIVGQTAGTTPANNLQVAVNQANLAPGNYTGSIVVTPANNAGPPQTIQVNLTVTGQATFTANPTNLSFTQVVGNTSPQSQTVTLTSAPAGLQFFLQVNPPTATWLTATANQATTPAQLTITANSANLPAGVYNASVTILAGGASQQSIPVTLNVAGSATLAVAPSRLDFTYAVGGPVPAAQQLAFSSNAAVIDFQVATSTPWLRVSPVSGRTPASVNVTIEPAGLAPGTYDGQITATATNANVPSPIPVRLVVTGPPAPVLTDFQNGASFLPTAAVPGQIITLRGTNLGPEQGVSFTLTSQGRLPTVVSDTRVFFDGIAAPVIFTSRNQVNAIVPYELTGRFSTRVQVEYLNQRSTALELRVVDSAPGIFTTNGRQAASLNQNNTFNGSTAPAPRGSIIQLYATGEGQTRPEGINGFVPRTVAELRTPLLPVVVRIGGVQAQVLYAGSAPEATLGLMQINAIVPSNIGTGDQPVEIQIGTAVSQAGVTIAVQ